MMRPHLATQFACRLERGAQMLSLPWLKPLYCTCALKVSRGLSILGKAMRGTPRGSSGLGLEGDPCVPLKLWTTHIPCGMRGKKIRVRLQPSMPGYLLWVEACPLKVTAL